MDATRPLVVAVILLVEKTVNSAAHQVAAVVIQAAVAVALRQPPPVALHHAAAHQTARHVAAHQTVVAAAAELCAITFRNLGVVTTATLVNFFMIVAMESTFVTCLLALAVAASEKSQVHPTMVATSVDVLTVVNGVAVIATANHLLGAERQKS